MMYSVDEKTLSDLKSFHIEPAAIIKRALKKEIRRRRKLLSSHERSKIVNRYTGEVLGYRRPSRRQNW